MADEKVDTLKQGDVGIESYEERSADSRDEADMQRLGKAQVFKVSHAHFILLY